jgi:hypothetical protein
LEVRNESRTFRWTPVVGFDAVPDDLVDQALISISSLVIRFTSSGFSRKFESAATPKSRQEQETGFCQETAGPVRIFQMIAIDRIPAKVIKKACD